MQATLNAYSIKPFIKALVCLSRYGEELTLLAAEDSLSLSTTNSSKSAYCRFTFARQFFSKYSVDPSGQHQESSPLVTGQLLAKSLLSIFKHRTIEKSLERCEISVTDNNQPSMGVDVDGLESKLTLRFHCKHGIIKTHRLHLMTPVSLLAPGTPDDFNESCLSIGPKALKDMIEHFTLARGGKADPQLVWNFWETEIGLKSLDSSPDTWGKAQLATELTISRDEFDVYSVHAPITIAFHLREFNATIAFAESMALPLEMRFTDPSAPLFIDVASDSLNVTFIISTSLVHGATVGLTSTYTENDQHRKRVRPDDPSSRVRVTRPMRANQVASVTENTNTNQQYVMHANIVNNSDELTPSNFVLEGQASQTGVAPQTAPNAMMASRDLPGEPLFWPGPSQPDVSADYPPNTPDQRRPHGQHSADGIPATHQSSDSLMLFDEAELAPTQSSSISSNKSFLPLFED